MTQSIAAIDVETKPAKVYTWSLYKPIIGLEQIVEEPSIICFAAKFNNKKTTEFYSDFHHGHEEMVRQLHRILDEADAVLHFNGKTFDIPWINTEIIKAGLTPPSPYKQIDLYQQTKKFRLLSHKLQHVSTHLLGLEGKVQHSGFSLWKRCMEGDEKAWALMRRYNKQDVDLLWEAFEPLLPWLKLPNANLFTDPDRPVCVNCGRDSLQSRGVERTALSTYRRYWCNPNVGGCGAWSRGNVRLAGAERTAVA